MFLQATPPVPREAANQPSQASQGSQNKATAEQAPSNKAQPVRNFGTSPPDQQTGPGQAGQNEDKSIIVRVLPVNVHKDWADYLYIGTTLLLVLITFGIAIIAWKQSNAAIISAKVARDTLYLTQAADIHIEGVNLVPPYPLSGATVIDLVVQNHGRTRAEKFTNDLTLGIKGRATGTIHPRSDIEVVIGAGQPFHIGFGYLNRTLTPEDLAVVLGGQAFLKFWGVMRYKDVFGRSYVIDCEGTYNPKERNFFIDRYEHRKEGDVQAN